MKNLIKKNILKVIGAIIGIVLITVLINKTDTEVLLKQLQYFRFNFLYVVAVTYLCHIFAAIGWHQCFLETPKKRSMFSLLNIRLAGEALAQINPANMIAGDTLKAVLVKSRLGKSMISATMSLLLWRIMYILSTGLIIVVSVGFIFGSLEDNTMKFISIVLLVIVFLLYFYIFFSLRYEHGIFSVISKFLNKYFSNIRFLKKVSDSLMEVDNDMVKFYHTKRKSFYIAFVTTILHRIAGSMEYYVIFLVLGIDVSVFSCIIFDTVTLLFRTSGFFIPGQIGLEEAGNKFMFSIYNIPGGETWLTVSLIRRTRQIFWILAGFLVYLFISSDPDVKKEIHTQS